jgi:stage II sporulation protein P
VHNLIKRNSIFFKKNLNLIILILILSILFCFERVLSNMGGIVLANNKPQVENRASSMKSGLHPENRFFAKAIHHTFPAFSVSEKSNPWEFAKGLNFSILDTLFQIDLKNPLTFMQIQFPASALHPPNQAALLGNREKQIEDSDQIQFSLDPEQKDAIAASMESIEQTPMDEDDLGELRRDIYLIGDEDIVDSLSSTSLTLQDVPKPQKIKLEKGKPQILIYHTHGTEAYKPASEGNYHTLKKEYSVLTVGEIIAEGLEKKGLHVIHDTTYHDYPSYSGSYSRSLNTAKEILAQNQSIKVIFDIHRDGFDNIDTNPNRANIINNNRVVINNETYARFMFVIGPAAPNRSEVEKFAKYINAVSDSKYPGLSKPVIVKPYGQFNQFLRDHYALIEVGSNANTIEEAKRTAALLVDIIAEAIENIKE